mgnify:CR=1 FL=1|jgi:hypothetical protein
MVNWEKTRKKLGLFETESWTWEPTKASKELIMSGCEVSINNLLPLLKYIN